MTVSGIRKLENRTLTVHRDNRGRVFYEQSQMDAILAGAHDEEDEEERRSRRRAESLEVDRQLAQYQVQYDAEDLARREGHNAAMEALRARSEREAAERAARLTAQSLSERWAVSLDELGALARLRLIVPADGVNSLLAQVCGWKRAMREQNVRPFRGGGGRDRGSQDCGPSEGSP